MTVWQVARALRRAYGRLTGNRGGSDDTSFSIVSILILSTAALGQHQGTPQQQRACRHDVTRFCRQQVDDYAIADCLRANMTRLRPVCRAVMEARR